MEVLDKMPVEICKIYENLYVSYLFRFKLFLDIVNSFFYHPNSIYENNKV